MGKLIQLEGVAATKYRNFLDSYRQKMGQEPGPTERTEAFFCSLSNDPWCLPAWCRQTETC